MKKIITLNEDELINLVKVISEQVDEEEYSEIDFYDVFITYFKQWLIDKFGDEGKKYPFSYMLKKYSKLFVEEVLEYSGEELEDSDFEIDKWNLERFTRLLLKSKKASILSMRSREFFTEKYKKQIDYIITSMKLPSYIRVFLLEDKPHEIGVQLIIDYPEMLKDDSDTEITTTDVLSDIERYFFNYFGIESSDVHHGGLSVTNEKPVYANLTDWTKNVLNKEIKKHMKSMPYGQNVKSVKFVPGETRAVMNITFSGGMSWGSGVSNYTDSVKDYLKKLGYHRIKVYR